MATCAVCGAKLATTFLGKLVGTTIKKEGKTHTVCNNCQKEHKNKLVEQL